MGSKERLEMDEDSSTENKNKNGRPIVLGKEMSGDLSCMSPERASVGEEGKGHSVVSQVLQLDFRSVMMQKLLILCVVVLS